MTLVDQHAPEVGVAPACQALGASRATWYRRKSARPGPGVRRPRISPRRLSDEERRQVLQVLCSEEFRDRSPRAVHAILLERGEYVCSVRTMYRVLAEHQAVRERRSQRRHPEYPVPVCRATAPNRLWTWDITKLRGPGRIGFSLYVILDVFSRYVVGWLLSLRESAILARQLIGESILRHGVNPLGLQIHADRGSPMRAQSLTQLMANLGVEWSYSRPRVSNDNPYSESQFKTLKYHREYPGRFGSFGLCLEWCGGFFRWYNQDHRHEGIGFYTPHDVYSGRYLALAQVRQKTLDAAYAMHPERFVGGRPRPAEVPGEVWINPPSRSLDLAASLATLPGGRGDPRGEGPRLPLEATPLGVESSRQDRLALKPQPEHPQTPAPAPDRTAAP